MKNIVLIVVASLFLSGCTLPNTITKKPAGIDITTIPPSTVFINGQAEGETPYKNQNMTPGEYVIKLVPISPDSTIILAPWETTIKLSAEVTTMITRTFAASEADIESSILQFQKEASSNTYLSVITDPDNVNINLDGKPNGFTPVTRLETTSGPHSLELTSPGYKKLILNTNTHTGYNLIVNVKLASEAIVLITPQPLPTPEATGSATLKPYVIIGTTETGWLRVRASANGTSTELGKVNEGEKLPYLSTDGTGWLQVTFEGKPGWISAKYATVVK